MLALVKVPNHRVVTNRKVCLFDESSAQISIPVLRVLDLFALDIARMLAPDTAIIGVELTNGREPPHVASLPNSVLDQANLLL